MNAFNEARDNVRAVVEALNLSKEEADKFETWCWGLEDDNWDPKDLYLGFYSD